MSECPRSDSAPRTGCPPKQSKSSGLVHDGRKIRVGESARGHRAAEAAQEPQVGVGAGINTVDRDGHCVVLTAVISDGPQEGRQVGRHVADGYAIA